MAAEDDPDGSRDRLHARSSGQGGARGLKMAKFTRVFAIPKLPVHWARGLRFRLTLSYVFFFTALLVIIGLVFKTRIQSQLEGSVREALEEEWGEAKGYFKIEQYQPVWIADPTDPEEA